MNTKKVCDQLNVTPKMLRIYEAQGLIMPRRLENTYRDYTIEDLFQIEMIVRLRKLGFTIKEIKQILQNSQTEEDYVNSFYIQIKAIDNKIDELAGAKQQLQKTVNKVINNTNLKDIPNIIYEAIAPDEKQNAYKEMLRQWDFDVMAANYVERFLKKDVGYNEGIRSCREIIEGTDRDKRILDVGCGTCNLWEALSGTYCLTALDRSLNMLMVARDKVPWAKFCLADITNMNEKELGQFDLVVATFMLHHIDKNKQELALKTMIDLCMPDGKLVIIEKCFKNHEERVLEEKRLEYEADYEALAILESEWYLYLEDLADYVHYRKCRMEVTEIAKNIRRFIIEKACTASSAGRR